MEATAGVDHGCPLSPLFFASGMADALESIDAGIWALDEGGRVFAYLDDIVVVVQPGQAEAAHNLVRSVLGAHGLALNEGKTAIWSRDPGVGLPTALAEHKKADLRLLGSDVRFLDRREDRDEFGSPIHGSVNGEAVVGAARGLTGRLRDLRAAGLSVKAAYTVLHTYGQSCCNHLQRANYEQGPWVEALERVLQDGLGDLVAADLGPPSGPCLLYTSPSPRDKRQSRMPSSA